MRALAMAIVLTLAAAPLARAEDPVLAFMKRVDAKAKADMDAFHRTVAQQFGVPEVQVRAVVGGVGGPGEAFMLFQLGAWSHQPIERVLTVYDSDKGKGWGAMAKELGIKPGSAEFHALKKGDLHYGGARASGKGGGSHKGGPPPGKGKGKPPK